jgi:Ca-activated chloride channel family protein
MTLAQAIIVPPREIRFAGTYCIQSISFDAAIKDQVAQVQFAQIFQNLSSRDLEVEAIIPIPADAAIAQFMLMIDGKEYPARIYTKEEANRIYESIVRSRRDPALLQFIGCGALQTKVFPLPAHGTRKITLRYTQVLKRDRDVSEILFPLAGGKLSSRPVAELKITARIDSPARIKSVYSPTYPVDIERPSDHSAIVRFTQNHIVPAEDLRLIWTVSDRPIGATLLSYRADPGEDGYFLLLTSPEVKAADKVVSKTVVFALDRSGSMAGQKIEQARNALKFVLNNLREGDTFNIIAYDDRVEAFKPELQRYNEESRAAALRFIDGITDGGSTNIDGALRKAFELIGRTGRPRYVIFLTDGLPTAGEQNESRIAENARNSNKGARLFAFGVGYDVNARLLDRLTTENSGVSEYVRPNENIEAAVSKFYAKMSAPVLTNVKLAMGDAIINRVYPRDLPDLFAGGQIIAVGRYRTTGHVRVFLSGRVGDREQMSEYDANLVERSPDDSYAFIEKIWATRRVGEIINELDLKGRNQELIDELVRLSTKHGILTPYTAFLADERTDLHAHDRNSARVAREVFEDEYSMAKNPGGSAGVYIGSA